ncbi:hypothetical protein VHUM_04035 [Vanrija humicola]|uniref:Symplekin n=1 Tax=Vanrija humicola TaxID=5417 RepID=A0A7D8UXW8_VANHU|nr:hypothetical protein VHUM_04035 [Vanrija humicola]
MSLYADEDIDLYAGSGPGAPSAPADPLQALAQALSAEAESPAQADALVAAGSRFEEHPDKLPDLCTKILPMVVEGTDTLLRAWTLEMLALAVGRASLHGEVKLEVAQASLKSLNHLLHVGSVATIRAVIPILSTVYPMLFRYLATANMSVAAGLNDEFQSAKSRILSFVLDPQATPQSVGIKAAAWKFVQKVLMVGVRASVDPRLAARSTDVSVALIQPGSPLNAAKVEEEATQLRNELVTQLYTQSDPAVLHPIMNTFPQLVKTRPALAPLIVSSVASWTPAAMEEARRPPMQVHAVEKTLRSVMGHIAKYQPLVGFSAQLHEALGKQKHRMELAWQADAEARRARRARIASGAHKHALEPEAESSAGPSKRARLEVMPGTGDGRGAVLVDVSKLPLAPVLDAVMAGLGAVTDEFLNRAFENARQAIINEDPEAVTVLSHSLFKEGELKAEEDEVINPLDVDLEEDDDFVPDLEPEVEENVTIADFRLPPPEPLPEDEKNGIVDIAVKRIWDSGSELAHLADLKVSDGPRSAVQPKEMWMLLLARLSSRGREDKRQLIGEFVAKDFGVRSKFATVWLNEEWLAKRRGDSNQYDAGLMAILTAYIPTLEAKDLSLTQFLLGLPELPPAAIDALEPLCEDHDRMIVGYRSLRELAEARPPLRDRTSATLLQLCTHTDPKIRITAITTVRRWVPNTAMSERVVAYALGVLRRLTEYKEEEVKVEEVKEEGAGEGGESKEDVKMLEAAPAPPAEAAGDQPTGEDGDQPAIQSKFLTTVTKENISQYVELAFALARREQGILDDIFQLYPKLPSTIQDIVEEKLTPLIRSLGPTPKLLDILRNFPEGADKLALRVVTTLSAEGSGPLLVNVIRTLMSERELDARFIIPVIGELDKGEIESQIPRIVSLLEQPDTKDVVRTAFASALQKMTPADLLVCLHQEEAGLKPTVEAIGYCFAMTTVFRSDVLANAMQRIVDQPTPIPVIFVRTIIQAVTTYKSLVPFIANNVVPKLVAKRVWEQPKLWDGFVRLLRILGQATFNALLQMPVERIHEVIEKQPTLKAPFKTFLSNKPAARAQLAQIFGDA